MRQSGQVDNFINYKQPKPEIGMGVTILHYTDRSAATIVGISKGGKRIILQSDIATRVDNNGMSESQKYEYSPNTGGKKFQASLRKDGQWRLSNDGRKVNLGLREAYHDYSF